MQSQICQITQEKESVSRTFLDDILGEESEIKIPVSGEKFPCGTVYKHFFDTLTGKGKGFPLLCGDQWECQVCHDKRKYNYQKRIMQALIVTAVSVVALEDPIADQLIAALDKDEYLRLPAFKAPAQRDDEYEGTGALFFAYNETSKEIIANSELKVVHAVADGFGMPSDFLYTWDELANTPDGKRPSGGLGRKTLEELQAEQDGETEDDEEEVKVEAPILTIEKQDPGVIEGIMSQAILETRDLDPQTAEELEEALQKRTDKAVEILKARGIAVLYRTTISRSIKISYISWTQKERPPRPPSPTQLEFEDSPPKTGNP